MTDLDPAREKLIVALDFPGAVEALDFDRHLEGTVRWVKVGLELFTAAGPAVVQALKERGRSVFLDLKLHDIPNTVAGAVRTAAHHGADMMTLHAEGGPAMMRAAADARDASGGDTKLLAVTVLTSLDGSEYTDVYRTADVETRVVAFARAAAAEGMDGVVCSPLELERLGSLVSPGFLRVTPGIRRQDDDTGDQARVATPAAAIRAGASHLVVGRPITRADDPSAAAIRVLEEILEAS